MTTQELIWNEVNCETGEVITRPFTDEERAVWEEKQAQADALRAEQVAAQAAVDAAKASASEKLAALGLTAEEIAALSK